MPIIVFTWASLFPYISSSVFPMNSLVFDFPACYLFFILSWSSVSRPNLLTLDLPSLPLPFGKICELSLTDSLGTGPCSVYWTLSLPLTSLETVTLLKGNSCFVDTRMSLSFLICSLLALTLWLLFLALIIVDCGLVLCAHKEDCDSGTVYSALWFMDHGFWLPSDPQQQNCEILFLNFVNHLALSISSEVLLSSFVPRTMRWTLTLGGATLLHRHTTSKTGEKYYNKNGSPPLPSFVARNQLTNEQREKNKNTWNIQLWRNKTSSVHFTWSLHTKSY